MKQDRSLNIGLWLGLIFVLVTISYLTPSIFFAQESPETTILEHTEGEQITLSSDFQTVATNIEAGGQDTVNITVINTATGDSDSTGELGEGDTASLSVSGNSISVRNIAVASQSTATVSYDYPIFMGWPEGAALIVRTIVAGFLAALLMFIYRAIIIARGDENGN